MGVSTRLISTLILMATCGCVLPGKFVNVDVMPADPIASVVAAWTPRVVFAPDPTNGGVPAPGIAGRVYLFGPTPDFPMAAEGTLFVELFDDTPRSGQTAGAKLEEWRLDANSMKRLLKKDAIGMGYTVFLPWGSYRSDVTQVHLGVRFDPANGSPLFAPSGSMTLDHGTPSSGPQLQAAAR